jgi:hypothetical protein
MPEHVDLTWLKPIQWGKLEQLPNGHWLTTWEIELETLDATLLAEVATAAADPDAGFTPRFIPQEQGNLVVTVETSRWGMEVDYYGLTYQLFRLIDSRVGRIRLIQGTPREWRNPFLSG